ncbi:M48 family metallopeptidase [Cellulomonas iranensis]|uniref:Zn-dependent protease with chaperone function n=1 Tax=Cellulomonas iranensis TaxID=76862 RepID=A0ABU0GK30_9CELL|nr:M48 family metallopeptidase [Cellulomonas iranensis]MDQ0425719.1 Zn-dependent protease with chaperone function [Cellulomonas iranensis]
MSTRTRAAVAVGTLIGFYLFAGALVVGLGLLAVLAVRSGSGANGVKLAAFAALALGGIVVALWKVARARPAPPSGPLVLRSDAPELWGVVDEVAALAGTAGPDEIRLVPEVNAGVMEDARLLGLVGGTRRMVLGVPLLHGLTVSQLRSVLAHELGHYSHDDTRLSVVVHRGREVIGATVEQLSGSLPGWLLRQYGKLYLLVSAATSRRQELAADALSVRAVGRATAQSALREVGVVDAAWDFYLGQYVSTGWDVGLAPSPAAFFGGFPQLLAARHGELGDLRTASSDGRGSRWDSHPPTDERLVAMDGLPDVAHVPDGRPARVLVPRLDQLAAALADETVAYEDRRRLDWPDLVPPAVAADEQRRADAVHRVVARLAGVPRGSVGALLDLVEQGRGVQLARELGLEPAPVHAPDANAFGGATLVDALASVLGAALVAAGAARWTLDWAGPAALRTTADEPVDLAAHARRAADPAQVAHVRAWLVDLGVDVEAVGQVAERATAHGASVVAGLATVAVDGAPHDVLVLDRGLVLVPCPKKPEGGKARLAAYLDVPVHRLAETHRYVAYEDVRAATVRRAVPVHAVLALHDGTTIVLKERWTGDTLTKQSQEVLAGHLASFAPLDEAAARTP